MRVSGVIFASVLCFAIHVQAGRSSSVPTCVAADWKEGTEYCEGQRVTLDARQYEAKWCTSVSPTNGDPYNAWTDLGPCTPGGGTPTPEPTTDPTPDPTPDPTSPPIDPGAKKIVGYFVEWGVYARAYYVKNVHTSGSAEKLTHIVYAFGNVVNSKCIIGDEFAAITKSFTAAESVDGVADVWDQPLSGNFNQLRKLKLMYPDIKIVWSFGGYSWSGGFGDASRNAAAFAKSCHDLVFDARWAGVFDGIDIDWEYPNVAPDASGPQAYATLLAALRTEFGNDKLITSAITADGSPGGKISKTDYGAGARSLDFMMVMTYDYWGAWATTGPTGAHAPLTSYTGMPPGQEYMYAEYSLDVLEEQGVPTSKLMLGIPFYGRGWTGVHQAGVGGTATGPAPGTELGVEDYKNLGRCPPTDTVGGTAIAYCEPEWWSYDSPETTSTKTTWAQGRGLAGVFFWELSGDTADGKLIDAIFSSMSTVSSVSKGRCMARR